MNVRKYTAATMEAALARVKSDLGRDAVILHTRCLRKGGVLGFGAREVVEVTASGDMRVTPRAAGSAPRPIDRVYRASSGSSEDFAGLRSDLSGLRAMVEDLVRQTRPSRTALWPDGLKCWYRHLTSRGMSDQSAIELLEPIAARLAGAKAGASAVRADVLAAICGRVRTASPIPAGRPGKPVVVAFVGPTGVGKTTTIAKLAANMALRERKAVGLVTLDTYRIAAVDQLRAYARIIELPLEVVLGPGEVEDALANLAACSVILVDTAGRSQRDALKINDLKAFFERRRPDEIHLVVAAASAQAAVADTVEKFSVYRPDRLIVTKLDELPASGKLLDVADSASLPLSYMTTGQDVPDDIETASPERFAALVAGEDSVDG